MNRHAALADALAEGAPDDHVHPHDPFDPEHDFDQVKLAARHPEILEAIAQLREEHARLVAVQAKAPPGPGWKPLEPQDEFVLLGLNARWPRLGRDITSAPNHLTHAHLARLQSIDHEALLSAALEGKSERLRKEGG